MFRFFAAVSILFFVVGCRTFKEPEFTGIKGFKVSTISTAGMSGDILISIKNPNKFGFSIYKSEFDVVYSGISLGKAKLAKRVQIRGGAEETYPFALSSDFKNVNLLEVMKLLNGANRKDLLEVKGDLKAGKFYMKKKFPVDLKERINLN